MIRLISCQLIFLHTWIISREGLTLEMLKTAIFDRFNFFVDQKAEKPLSLLHIVFFLRGRNITINENDLLDLLKIKDKMVLQSSISPPFFGVLCIHLQFKAIQTLSDQDQLLSKLIKIHGTYTYIAWTLVFNN